MAYHRDEVINLSSSPSPEASTSTTSSTTTSVKGSNNGSSGNAGGLGVINSQQPGLYLLTSLDRAAMERERLVRVSRMNGGGRPKRHREIESVEATDWPHNHDDDGKRTSEHVQPDWRDTVKRTRQDHGLALKYAHGVVKKTAVNGYARNGDDVTIEEILQPDVLRHAVLSAFQWNYEWVLRKLSLGKTELVLVVPAKGTDERNMMKEMLSTIPNTRVCMPSMAGMINCMHSKLQLLFFDTYLRVCVPSANMTDYDWGEGAGVIENVLYVQDFPLKPAQHDNNHGPGETKLPPFAEELIYFLQAQEMFADIIDRLRTQVVWQHVEDVRFVHSIGGEARVPDGINRTGFPGLARAIRSLGANGQVSAQLDYVVSSVGSLTPVMLESIYLAGIGARISTEVVLKSDPHVFNQAKSRFRLYFPTHDTVGRCKGGFRSAGTICFQRSYWMKPVFPGFILRDGRSVRKGCLMHEKILYVRFDQPFRPGTQKKNYQQGGSVSDDDDVDDNESYYSGIAYVGSANMSESAWGKLVMDSQTKRVKLCLRNWECGVALRVKRPGGVIAGTELSVQEIFAEKVPVPMETTGTEYGDKIPWFFAEQIRKYR
ncbi:tyrosyl-DNA phosphodiesterase-domain-containing protein [Lipomyces japonicus]|uniref:tyrosyl-DNA phosphodiesterase-domain-containing protein n=1 Tax=Lipomyces japonicus TaxID=56871 RepID=UPI0034CF9DDE